MIDVNQLRKGTTFTRDGDLFRVTDYKHTKTGRGNATIRVKVRNLRTGTLSEMSFGSGNSVEDIKVEARTVQYLYEDGEFLHFMDMDSYEQPQLRREVFGEDFLYLKENMEMKLLSHNSEIIDYELPAKMDYKVVETEMAVAGDRANNPTKKIKLETGLEITAPMFVNVGDTVQVNIETGEYVTRVNA